MSDNISLELEAELTPSQIEDIISVIEPKSISEDAQKDIENSIKGYLRDGLKGEKMTPQDIIQLKYALKKHYNESKAHVGEYVGILAALSMGEPSTQMALNAHRTSGNAAKSSNAGIQRLDELLRVSDSQKAISMSIFFKEHLTLTQIRNKIPNFVRTYLEFYIKDAQIIKSTDKDIDVDYRDVFFMIYPELEQELISKRDRSSYIRLYIDYEKLYSNNTTIEHIVEKIKESDIGDYFTVLYSSGALGIIDIFTNTAPLPDKLPSHINQDTNQYLYLSYSIIPLISKIIISGIDKITKAYPQRFEINFLLEPWKNSKNIKINIKKMRKSGVTYEMIRNLLIKVFDPVDKQNSFLIDPNNPALIKAPEICSYSDIVNKTYEDDSVKEANTVWFLETAGSNLIKVLAMDDVNEEITTCTDPREISQVFGIQAARDYLIEEYIRILSVDSWIDPRHLILLADVMVNSGSLLPVTASGVSKHKDKDILGKVAFENPTEHLLRAAFFGESGVVNTTTAALFFGNMNLNFNEVKQKEEVQEEEDLSVSNLIDIEPLDLSTSIVKVPEENINKFVSKKPYEITSSTYYNQSRSSSSRPRPSTSLMNKFKN